jgi:hypothetical protein
MCSQVVVFLSRWLAAKAYAAILLPKARDVIGWFSYVIFAYKTKPAGFGFGYQKL